MHRYACHNVGLPVTSASRMFYISHVINSIKCLGYVCQQYNPHFQWARCALLWLEPRCCARTDKHIDFCARRELQAWARSSRACREGSLSSPVPQNSHSMCFTCWWSAKLFFHWLLPLIASSKLRNVEPSPISKSSFCFNTDAMLLRPTRKKKFKSFIFIQGQDSL